MAGYDERICNDTRKYMDARFEKGEKVMSAHEKALNDHSERIAIMERLAERRENLAWRIAMPVIECAGVVASGLILAWLLKG